MDNIMEMMRRVINCKWLYLVLLLVSALATYGCCVAGAPGKGMLVCGWCLGCSTVFALITFTGGKLDG